MSVTLPQEIEVWYIIPAIRRELARAMLGTGLKQRDIAGILGITEAAVSHYINSKRADYVKFSRGILEEIKRSADNIVKGGNVIMEIQRLCNICRKEGIVCRIGKMCGNVPRHCRVCFE